MAGEMREERSVTVDVSPVISNFTATPNPAPRGGTVTLAWMVVGAEQLRIRSNDQDIH